jgi:type III restriction enzyme
VRPERDSLEIKFPRISGYRVEFPKEELTAHFTEDHHYQLSPQTIGPTRAILSGIVGETHEITPDQLKSKRPSSIIFTLTNRLIEKHYRDDNGQMRLDLFAPLKRIVRNWFDNCLTCVGGTYPAQALTGQIADAICTKIYNAINSAEVGSDRIFAVPDHFNPVGSSASVNFNTSKPLYTTDPRKSHVNYVVYDSEWEADFARVCDIHPLVISYVKNQSMGFEVPYLMGADTRRYIPDFILQIDAGNDTILNLIVEIKGYRGEDAKAKADTMQTYWVPGVNNLGNFGTWAFLELTQPFTMEHVLTEYITEMLDDALPTIAAHDQSFIVK